MVLSYLQYQLMDDVIMPVKKKVLSIKLVEPVLLKVHGISTLVLML